MDENLAVVSKTLLASVLTTKDIYVILRRRGIYPLRTTFSKQRDYLCVDFEYDNGIFASDYLIGEYSRVDNEYCRAHTSVIAKELSDMSYIDDDIDRYVKSHKHVRKAEIVCKNKYKVDKLRQMLYIGNKNGVDFGFIHDSLL